MTREDFLARIRRPLARERAGRTDWYRIQNKAGEKAALYIYDEIGYWGDTAQDLVNALKDVDSDSLDVHVNSPGGDIFDGLAIYQALREHKARITVKVDGLAASIASVIAMAGDEVIMAPKASLMIHDGWTMAVGNAADLRKTADLLDKQSGVIASVYADKSSRDANFWRDAMREETWYTAQEAVDAGLADQVEGQEKKPAEEPFDLGVYAHAGRDKAPAPTLTAEVTDPAPETSPAAPPAEQPKAVEPAFAWDFAAFKSALRGE